MLVARPSSMLHALAQRRGKQRKQKENERLDASQNYKTKGKWEARRLSSKLAPRQFCPKQTIIVPGLAARKPYTSTAHIINNYGTRMQTKHGGTSSKIVNKHRCVVPFSNSRKNNCLFW